MALSEETVFPLPAEEVDHLVNKAHGFVAANLEEPFADVSVRLVSQSELAHSLSQMIEEVKELTFTQSRMPRFLEETFRSGEKAITNSFVRLLAGKILGLYTQSYKDNTPGQLLLVGENIDNVARSLNLPTREFFLWILVHETMHIAQFNSKDSYLRDYIKDKIIAIGKKEGDVKKTLSEAATAMTWIEGSADAMMDQKGLIDEKLLEKMRQKIEARRNKVSWSSILLQLLTKKTSQYREGGRFCKAVSEKYGMSPMSLIIKNPEWLPTAEEIKAPSLWIQRFEERID